MSEKRHPILKYMPTDIKWWIALVFAGGVLYTTITENNKKTDENRNYIDKLYDIHLDD